MLGIRDMERTFRGVIRRSMSLAHARTFPKDFPASKIRRMFIEYFCEENKHLFIRSSPVFSLLDPTLPFVNAGMNQFKDVFLGLVQPASTRVANSQKCIRISGKHNDLSQVGRDGSHHTFFEMLGNWSFGDYFKEEACRMSWELLTKVYGIPPERLYVTYYKGDEALGLCEDTEVREIWRQIGVEDSRILPFGTKENFWEGGLTGPCGPCTEIHYDTVPGRTDAGHLVNGPGNEVIELWNLVFTQYNRKANGELKSLNRHFVDTGMGFERLVAVLQGKANNYESDLFMPLFDVIKNHTGHSGYTGQYEEDSIDCGYRILADHSRMLAVALGDGMMPKRQVRVRVVLKKALHVAERQFGANVNLLKELTSHVAEMLSDAYPEVGRNLSKTHLLIDSEAELMKAQTNETMAQWKKVQTKYPSLADIDLTETPQLLGGMNYLEKNVLKEGKFLLTGEDIWMLHDTYGVPIQMTELLALKLGLQCDMDSYNKKKQSEKEADKESQEQRLASMRTETPYVDILEKLEEKNVEPTADYFKYDYRPDSEGKYIFKSQPTTIEAILFKNQLTDELSLDDIQGEEVGLVLDRTQLFVKEGSQENDTGTLRIENQIDFDIKRLIKIKNYVIHFGTFTHSPSGAKVSLRDIGVLKLNEERRMSIMRNHTALHLVNAAIRSLLPVVEKFSLAQPEKLVFNFLVNESKLKSDSDMEKVEKFVKEFILHGVSVKRRILNHSQFQAVDDVVFIPGEPIVQSEIPVVEINSGFKLSKEYCTGTHLLNTSEIKDFIIMSFVKGSYGNQEIQAVTGDDCLRVRTADSEKREEWTRLREEFANCNDLAKVNDLHEKIKKFHSDVRTSTEMSHVCKLKLFQELRDAESDIKSLKGNVIAREIENVCQSTPEMFVIHCLERDSEFQYSSLEKIKNNSLKKPLMLVVKRYDSVTIRCYVPRGFVSKKFSAEKWVLDTVMPFGGIGYYREKESPELMYMLKERKFTENQFNELLEIARDIAEKSIRN